METKYHFKLGKDHYLEYDMTEAELDPCEMRDLASKCIDNPIYIRIKDKSVAAVVGTVAIKDDSFLMKIKFKDVRLENFFSNERYVEEHFLLVDPVLFLLENPH